MNAIPCRIATMPADWPSDDEDEPFYDADYYGHPPDEDEVSDLRRTLRTAGPDRAALIEARLEDADLVRRGIAHKKALGTGWLK